MLVERDLCRPTFLKFRGYFTKFSSDGTGSRKQWHGPSPTPYVFGQQGIGLTILSCASLSIEASERSRSRSFSTSSMFCLCQLFQVIQKGSSVEAERGCWVGVEVSWWEIRWRLPKDWSERGPSPTDKRRAGWGNGCLISSVGYEGTDTMVAHGNFHKTVCLNAAVAASRAAGTSWEWPPKDWRHRDCRGGRSLRQSWGSISGRIAQQFSSSLARYLLTIINMGSSPLEPRQEILNLAFCISVVRILFSKPFLNFFCDHLRSWRIQQARGDQMQFRS